MVGITRWSTAFMSILRSLATLSRVKRSLILSHLLTNGNKGTIIIGDQTLVCTASQKYPEIGQIRILLQEGSITNVVQYIGRPVLGISNAKTIPFFTRTALPPSLSLVAMLP